VLLGARTGLLPALVFAGLLSGIAHLAFLGRFERAWRILRRPHSSWISRGMWSLVVFVVSAAGFLAVGGEGAAGRVLLALSLVGASGALLYEGFVYAASRAIPFWHSPLLPALYAAYGLRGGAALLLVAAAVGGRAEGLELLEAIKLWTVVSAAVLVLLYLAVRTRAGGAARHSVRRIVVGGISPAFYGGALVLGIVLPLALAALREPGPAGFAILAAVGLCSLAGDFYVKYCVAKAGSYVPLAGRGLAFRRSA
jgi:formate-dependent nitrite reductase membrane component NrfD